MFWEHAILDDKDFEKHVEYIHYNPVKHGLTAAPKDWEYSSFHRYVKSGLYDQMWVRVRKCRSIWISVMNKIIASS